MFMKYLNNSVTKKKNKKKLTWYITYLNICKYIFNSATKFMA